MAMPVTDDCNPAIAGAARRLRAASVSGSLQAYAQLAFDHGLDEAAHPITHHGFNRVEPIVEKIHSRISDRLRGIMLRDRTGFGSHPFNTGFENRSGACTSALRLRIRRPNPS